MPIRIEYIYIYTPRPVRPAGPVMPADIREKLAEIEARAGGPHATPEIKAKLDKIRGLTARILGIIEGIKSPALQAMLKQVLNEVLAKAEGGNLDGAIEDLNTLVNTCERISDKVKHGQVMCSALAANTVPGPAGALLQAIAKAGLEALAACTSERGLDEILGLLERSMEIMARLAIIPPTDPKYIEYCKELKSILGRLEAMDRADPLGPQLEGDQLLVTKGLSAQVEKAIQSLKERQRSANEGPGIEALEKALKELVDLVGQGAGEGGVQRLNAILHQAMQGDVAGALEAAQKANQELTVLVKRKAYGGALLARLDEVVKRAKGRAEEGQEGGPKGPPLAAMQEALGQALAKAQSAEELAQVEELLRLALNAGRALDAGATGIEAAAARRDLATVAKALGLPAPGEGQGTSPTMGADRYGEGPHSGGASSAAGASSASDASSASGASSTSGASSAAGASDGQGASPAAGGPSGSAGRPPGAPAASSGDPLASVEVPNWGGAVREEGQRCLQKGWALSSSMEGPHQAVLVAGLQRAGEALQPGQDPAEALAWTKALVATVAAAQRLHQAQEGSGPAKQAEEELLRCLEALPK